MDGIEVEGTEGMEVTGGEGNEGKWRSRDIRFDAGEASSPAFCSLRMRSAMLPPGLRIGPSVLSDSDSL